MSAGIRARLDAMQARAVAATEGPWEVQEPGGWATISSGPDSVFHAYSEHALCPCGEPVDGSPEVSIGIEDAEFIAAARTDLPALLAFARDVLDLADHLASLPGNARAAERLRDQGAKLHALADRHLGGEAAAVVDALGERLAQAWDEGKGAALTWVQRQDDADAAGQHYLVPEPRNPYRTDDPKER